MNPKQWYATQPEHANGWWVVSTDPEGDETIDASGDGGFNEDIAKFVALGPEMFEALQTVLCSHASGKTDLSPSDFKMIDSIVHRGFEAIGVLETKQMSEESVEQVAL